MKQKIIMAVIVVSIFAFIAVRHYSKSVETNSRAISSSEINVLFSPKGGCTEAIVAMIAKAQKTILIQAYSFTSDPIEAALVAAHKRGVKVRVIVDRSQTVALGTASGPLAIAGIDVYIDAKHQIAHNKTMVIDDEIVITGSFNFTRQAEIGNAENLLIIRDASLALKYSENWHGHQAHSQPYHPQQ